MFHIVNHVVFFFLQWPDAEMQEEGQQDENKYSHCSKYGQDGGIHRVILLQINREATHNIVCPVASLHC